MVQLTLPKNSRVTPGKTWPRPAHAIHGREFRVYRWELWLKTVTPAPERERLQSPEERNKLVGFGELHPLLKACPKGLNPAKAIAEIKRMMVERQM